MPPGNESAAMFRPHRANGPTPDLVSMLSDTNSNSSMTGGHPGPPPIRRSVSGMPLLRPYSPLLVLLLVAALMLLWSGSWLHHGTPATTTSPEQLSSTIAQLSQNQATMMQMLQKMSAANKGAGGGGDAAAAASDSGTKGPGGASERSSAAFAAIPVLTTLHNTLLRKSHKYEEHRAAMLATFQRLVHLEPAAAAADIEAQLPASGADPARAFSMRLYRLLLSTGKLIPCREDATLKVNDATLAMDAGSHHWYNHHAASSGSTSTSGDGTGHSPRYYFATNLRDNSVNMPHYILSLLQTLLRLPLGSAFVSAYESNSDDGAHGWVDVLQLALNVIGTPNHLVTRGMLVRLEGSNRIEHLARVRNMALTPLYQHYAAARSRQGGGGGASSNTTISSSAAGRRRRRQRQRQRSLLEGGPGAALLEGDSSSWADVEEHEGRGSTSSTSSSSSSSRRLRGDALTALSATSDAANLPPGVLPWDPDFVVFVNDAYFCWSMVHRLLNYRADITCGMDFWQNADATVELPPPWNHKAHKKKPHIPADYKLERPITQPLGRDQKNPIVFYDVWVARDLSGAKFWWTYPFVHDETTTGAAQKGLPFRASCCWNGLAVLRAAPFAAGLRIRPPMEGECRGSECTMVCDDFARLGYQNVVVDAGVQLTYDWSLAREMMALGIEGFGQSTWGQAKAAGIAGHSKKPAYAKMECCGLKSRFTQWVNFNTDCEPQDVFATNWTHKVLYGTS